jgi:alanyl-tRNA synthetase
MSKILEHKFIIADHIRTASFVINDGVFPAAKGRGYILRRLIRRTLRSSIALGIDTTNPDYFTSLVSEVSSIYKDVYNFDIETKTRIVEICMQESVKYQKAIKTGEKEWQKIIPRLDKKNIEENVWNLYQSHGVPLELSESILEANGFSVNNTKLLNFIEKHQEISNTIEKGDFKSGLISDSPKTVAMHTVTHIIHSILRELYGNGVGDEVRQMGSSITDQKARFDFSCSDKILLNPEDISCKVNEVVNKNLIMSMEETTPEKAKLEGAIGLFGEKYGSKVTVYTLSDQTGKVYSKEFCTGPHIDNTKNISKVNILKVKSLGAGVKRIEFDIELT